ncbi:MAG: toprim domain-containing protein [Candidatus Yanofskybacteria bacterium]|nr:toprim domain-containing protein [Candidatus Yanofskybacteria bacterium]
MFPVSDANGRVVGFTGRIFEDKVPTREVVGTPTSDFDQATKGLDNSQSVVAKYINTPQTLIYDKSRILYGLDHSRTDIRKKDKCLLVEGNMDAIMSYQAGVTHVVASSGTALTPMHLAILKRFTNNLDFCFDTDSAGVMATKRGIAIALGQDFNVKAVSLDDPVKSSKDDHGARCKDPADYIQRYGSNLAASGPGVGSQALLGNSVGASWIEVVEKAKPVVEFYFDKAKESYNPESAESKKNVILTVAPFVKRLVSNVERTHWVNQLAYLLRVKEEAVEADIRDAPDIDVGYVGSVRNVGNDNSNNSNKPAGDQTSEAGYSPVPREAVEQVLNEALLSLVVKKPVLFKQEIMTLDKSFLNPLASQVLDELAKEDLEQFNFSNFIKKFDSDPEQQQVVYGAGKTLDVEFVYLRSQALWDDFKDDELKMEFKNIFNKLKQKTIHLRLADLGYEMRAAEAVGDRAKIGELASVFNKLAGELAEIHKI